MSIASQRWPLTKAFNFRRPPKGPSLNAREKSEMRPVAYLCALAVVPVCGSAETHAQSSIIQEAVTFLNTCFSDSQASLLVLTGTKMWHFNHDRATSEFDFRDLNPNYETSDGVFVKLNCNVENCVSGTGDKRANKQDSIILRFNEEDFHSARFALDYIFSEVLTSEPAPLPAQD